MKYGYARVSTEGQNLASQKEALLNAGVEKLYSEKVSGKSLNRDKFLQLFSEMKSGDTLVVTKMDRIARNVMEGMKLIDTLIERGITLHVLNMGVFDNTPTSRLIQNILLSVADWERQIMLERQKEGIEQAKKAGKYKGRPATYTNQHKGLEHALELFENRSTNDYTVTEIAEMTGINRRTIYRKAKELKELEEANEVQ